MDSWKDQIKDKIIDSATVTLPKNWEGNLIEQFGFAKNVLGYSILDILGKKYRDGLSNNDIAAEMQISSSEVDDKVDDAFSILRRYNSIIINGYDYCKDNNMLSPELEKIGVEKSSIIKLSNSGIFTPIQIINADSDNLKTILGDEYERTMDTLESSYDDILTTADTSVAPKKRSELDCIKSIIDPIVGKVITSEKYKEVMNAALAIAGLPILNKHVSRNSTKTLLSKLGNYEVQKYIVFGEPGYVKLVDLDNNKEEGNTMAKRKKKYQKRNESYLTTTEVSDLVSKYGVDAFTMRFLDQAGIKTSADVDKIESNFDLVAALMPCGPEANKVRTILIDCLNKNGYDTIRFGKPMSEDVKEDRALTNIEINDLKADSSLNRYFGFKVTDDNKAKAIDYIKTVINKEITNDEMEEIVKRFSLIWRGLEKDDKPMTYKSFRTYLGNYHLSIHILPNRNLIIEEPNRTIGKKTIIPKNKELTKTDIDLAIKKAKDDVREALTEQPYALNEEEVFEAIKRRPAVEASDMKVTVMFNCPICGKETFYSTTVISTLSSIDAIIYCRKCFNKIRVK